MKELGSWTFTLSGWGLILWNIYTGIIMFMYAIWFFVLIGLARWTDLETDKKREKKINY